MGQGNIGVPVGGARRARNNFFRCDNSPLRTNTRLDLERIEALYL